MKIPFKWRQRGYRIRRKLRSFKRSAEFYLFDFDTRIYHVNQAVEPYLRGFTIFLSLVALVSILLPLGFNLDPEAQQYNEAVELGVMVAFMLQFLVRLVLTPNRVELIKYRWMETLATGFALLFLIQFSSDILFHTGEEIHFFNITFSHTTAIAIVQGYLTFFIIVKSLQSLPQLIARQRNTSQFLLVSFLTIIGVGTILLMLPKATADAGGLPFIDALFTSTSAICVTGLIVVDTATKFTLLGQFIILVLIQIGGLGIITFATFLALFVNQEFTVGQKNVLRDVVQERNVSVITATLKRIVGLTLLIELLGAAAYYLSWTNGLFSGSAERLLFSVFHAVSAFCNAGFSLFTNSLSDPANATNLPVNLTTMLLIIFGGLGFPTIWDLYHRIRGKKYRIAVQTRIILIMTGVLIFGGAILILFLEQGQIFQGYSYFNQTMFALFQSVTARTAGFNTLDIGALSLPVALIIMLLMVIGASPASTAGGIKTTTAYMLISSVVNTIRGKSRLEIGHRTIPPSVLRRALTSVTLAFITLSVSTILLAAVEDFPLLDLLFEEISAFATVGLSRGITAELSSWGKLIIIISMFVGRLGSLTLAASFVIKRDNRKYQYPEESIMVS